MMNVLRAILAVLFAIAGVLLLFRDQLLPAEWVNAQNPMRLNLKMGFAFVLAAWNVVRLYAGLRRRAPRQPLAERRGDPDARPFEYNPQLDFFRETGTSPPSAESAPPPADRPAG